MRLLSAGHAVGREVRRRRQRLHGCRSCSVRARSPPANGFAAQADVVIDARIAADLLGATRMDRPEDVQPNPVNGRVYVMLTNNKEREPGREDAANPRADNVLRPHHRDDAAGRRPCGRSFRWDVLVRCGDPAVAAVGALWNPETSAQWLVRLPRQCRGRRARAPVDLDRPGRAPGRRVAPTGSTRWKPKASGARTAKLFFRVPVGAELCGPCFTPGRRDAVRRRAASGRRRARDRYKGFERASTFADPATRWPDFDPAMPPRPSVLVITKNGGGKIA